MAVAQHDVKSPRPAEDTAAGVAERLDRLEQSVQDLQQQLAHLERASDRDWQAREVAGRATVPAGVRMSSAAVAFVEALSKRDQIFAELSQVDTDGAWAREADAKPAADLERLWDRLAVLASALVDCPAVSSEEMRVKALALKELSEENSDDVVHRLATSLADDVLGKSLREA